MEQKLLNQIRQLLKEYYESDKLYDRDYMVNRLMARDKQGRYFAPREIRAYVKDLPYIDCIDSQGNPKVCTKIPEVIYVYLTGRY